MKRAVDVMIAVVFALGICAAASTLVAQDSNPAPAVKPGSTGEKTSNADDGVKKQLQEVLNRLERVENELRRLKKKNGVIPEDKKEQRVTAMLEDTHLGSS